MEETITPYWGNKVTVAEYDALWKAQGGVCSACGKPEQSSVQGRPRKLAVDHCHTTGRVRGLLCGNCNRALGLLYEDPERIKGLLRYIEERCANVYDIQAEIAPHYVLDKLEGGATDNLY